jgi:hypothetical protein
MQVALKGKRSTVNRNYEGHQVYVAYNRRRKMWYVGMTSKSFNERYKKRDYKHHFSNAFYCDPTAFDIKVYPMTSRTKAFRLEAKLVGWQEAKSNMYYNKIPGGNIKFKGV